MIVLAVFSALTLSAISIPANKYKWQLILSAALLSLLYLFFVPSKDYDLFRHFEVMNIVEGMSFKELFFEKVSTDNWLLADYLDSSQVYLFYLFLISRLRLDTLLPVITVLIVYATAFLRIHKLGKEENISGAAVFIAFITVLFVMDYRDLSGIRNMLAYSLFTYTVYEELVNKRNPIACFSVYILLCGVHMSCVILLALRVAVLISQRSKVLRTLAAIAIFGIYTFAMDIISLISGLVGSPYLESLVYKITVYREGRKDYNPAGAVVYISIISVLFVVYLIARRQGLVGEKFKSYSLYTLFVFAFTAGAFLQYDIIRRNTTLIMLTALPFVILYFGRHIKGSVRRFSLTGESKFDVLASSGYAVFLIFCLAFFWWISYLPMDAGFGA